MTSNIPANSFTCTLHIFRSGNGNIDAARQNLKAACVCIILTHKILQCAQLNYNVSWSRVLFLIAALRVEFLSFYFQYWKELFEFTEDLDRELFKASAIDQNILEIYNQFCALRE